jgi:hypothetical protein
MQQAISVEQSRVDLTGSSGAQVQQLGSDMISVTVPGTPAYDIVNLVVFLFTKPMVTLLAGTRFFGGGHRWSGLDPARLGASTRWRSSAR